MQKLGGYAVYKGEMSSNTSFFKNLDGSRVEVVLNPYENEKTITINGASYALASRSFNGIVLYLI